MLHAAPQQQRHLLKHVLLQRAALARVSAVHKSSLAKKKSAAK